LRRSIIVILLFAFAYAGYVQLIPSVPHARVAPATIAEPARSTTEWRSGEQVRGSGTVTRVLSDDNDGSRHQRFILELSSGRTLLIAHNIDLAPRVSSLRTGDTVAFYGEFETNSQGGVIHWTHRDPQGRHTDGWLEYKGQRYQ
jgi:hypothetical protein